MSKTRVKVLRFKGQHSAERGISRMLSKGWEIQDQASRKAVWSPVTGLFTRKQIHTVTFVREK
jgi:hypothetical protein